MSEAKYYNALNLLYRSDYSKLQKAWKKFQNWEKAFINEKSGINAEKEWKKLADLNISLLLKENPSYPELLKEIPLPPLGIYALGNLGYKKPSIAIIGTRNATPQGKELAKFFSEKLSLAGMPIISGLAMGIDEFAHKGALEGGAKTIAVLGTPINHIYPKHNEQLAKNILGSGGAIISEFPIDNPYRKDNFLIRNRIISGLANALLIIEAPERSGSLATARFALDQNREMFVIPGNIGAANYKGSNALIKAGATPVTEPSDILNYFGINSDKIVSSGSQSGSQEEKEILNAFKKEEKLTIEQLLETTKKDLSDLNKNLAMLTIKGIIKETNGKYYLNI